MANIESLEKKVDQILNLHSEKAKSVDSVHRGAERSLSFFETDDNHSISKSAYGRPVYRNRKVTLPKGYEPSDFRNFGDFVRKGMKDEVGFKNTYGKAFASLSKALDLNTSAFEEGGALVLPEFAPEIMAMLYESESLWGRTRQYTVAGNSMKFPRLRDYNHANGQRHGGALGYWLGEGDTITESQVKMDETDISLKKLCVAVFLTEEMISDSGYAIEQFVTEVVQAEIDYQLDRALVRGDGVSKPLGVLSSGSLITVAKESGQAADTILATNIDKMWARRLGDGDYVWLYNQDAEPELANMYYSTGSNSGQLTFMPPTGQSQPGYMTIKGKPAIPSLHCSTVGDVGDIILAKLSDFISINKGQVNQLASPHVAFLQDKLCLKFTFRVNGKTLLDSAVTVEQSAQTRSSFIALAARA